MQNITLPEKIVICIAVLLVVVLGSGAYLFYTHHHAAKAESEPTTQAIIESVAKIAELPNEQPTLATVTDKEQLAHFTFFSQARLGDKVLIFNEAKKAYLYRPSTNKIIEVGPIMITEAEETIQPQSEDQNPHQASVAAVQTEPPTVTLLNGTQGKGVAAKAEKDLTQAAGINIQIKVTGNSKKDYDLTKIAVVTESARPQAEKIAQLFQAEIIDLPAAEAKPKTDLVVFLGTDRL